MPAASRASSPSKLTSSPALIAVCGPNRAPSLAEVRFATGSSAVMGSAMATSPAGRLRKKIARQLNPDVSAPPATGPPAMATVPPTAHTAMAFARRTGSP
jgi:hypothetical protein